MPRLETEMWTAEMVRGFPDDGNRYEVIAGELLVTPAPTWDHQRAVLCLFRAIDLWIITNGIGETVMSPADLELEPHGLVQPDLFVVPPNADGSAPRSWSEISALVLAAEVLSPSTARDDRGRKRELFSRVNVPEYWVVDPEQRVIERWRPNDELPELCNRTLVWEPHGAASPLAIDVAKLFRDALRP